MLEKSAIQNFQISPALNWFGKVPGHGIYNDREILCRTAPISYIMFQQGLSLAGISGLKGFIPS